LVSLPWCKNSARLEHYFTYQTVTVKYVCYIVFLCFLFCISGKACRSWQVEIVKKEVEKDESTKCCRVKTGVEMNIFCCYLSFWISCENQLELHTNTLEYSVGKNPDCFWELITLQKSVVKRCVMCQNFEEYVWSKFVIS